MGIHKLPRHLPPPGLIPMVQEISLQARIVIPVTASSVS